MSRANIENCRKLRHNQTDAERKLWMLLRSRQLDGVKFRRQYYAGGYILDFYSPEYKLGIEADGGQHYEYEGIRKDQIRTEQLYLQGIEIIRFSDIDILKNPDGVYEAIQNKINNNKKTPPSS